VYYISEAVIIQTRKGIIQTRCISFNNENTMLHVSAVRCHHIYLQPFHTSKTPISYLHSVCMTHGYYQCCTYSLLFI